MSAVANLAIEAGFQVSGCDQNTDTPYISSLKNKKIRIYKGNSKSHLDNDTQLIISPAATFSDNKEVKAAKKPITWQNFLGENLAKDKITICIAGTHGKSTTTALTARVFEEAGFDPSVMIGAKVNAWGTNYRSGKGEYFIIESDEFYDNFLNYSPDVIILNNIEFDHPDYFKSESQLFSSFKKHIESLKGLKTLIYNKDDLGNKKLIKLIDKNILKNITLIPFSIKNKKKINVNLIGEHNQANALAVIKLSEVFNVDKKIVQTTLKNFRGIGRRMEIIFSKGPIIIDDYAHHPTAIRKTLKALREKYPKNTVHAIIEPHSFSRTKATLPLYKNAFESADYVYIAPIFKGRDTEDFGINEESIIKMANHKNISKYDHDEFKANKNDVIIVMGAGNSYKIARELVKKHEN